jgi:hypothetical protein
MRAGAADVSKSGGGEPSSERLKMRRSRYALGWSFTINPTAPYSSLPVRRWRGAALASPWRMGFPFS